MKFTAFHNKIQDAFFRQGWLLPVVLPLTQLGGRALFNMVAGVYALWGLLSLWSRRERLDRMTALLYLILLSAFLLGIPGAMEPAGALRAWGMFLMHSLTVLLMQAALQESPVQICKSYDFISAEEIFVGGIKSVFFKSAHFILFVSLFTKNPP